jgi:LAO/AO transport system kinase
MYDQIIDPENQNSALKVQKKINPPDNINSNFISGYKKKSLLTANDYLSGILDRNISILAQAITLVESNHPKHQQIAQEIIQKCLPYSGKSIRIAITGVPGAGKSTFIDVFGTFLTNSKQEHKVAVLAIDPSSQKSKGSILGDKTRMERLSVDKRAFIRPSAAADSLGGVAKKTRETIILCEAAGFDTVIIETVGVGQSEVAAYSMVDFFLLLQLSNQGDELQGIKRGIMEMADLIAINKAEKDNMDKSLLTQSQIKNALHLFPVPESNYPVNVVLCSAVEETGIEEIWKIVEDYVKVTKHNGYFYSNRKKQELKILDEHIIATLKYRFYNNETVKEEIEVLKAKILNNEISAYQAAEKLVNSEIKNRDY